MSLIEDAEEPMLNREGPLEVTTKEATSNGSNENCDEKTKNKTENDERTTETRRKPLLRNKSFGSIRRYIHRHTRSASEVTMPSGRGQGVSDSMTITETPVSPSLGRNDVFDDLPTSPQSAGGRVEMCKTLPSGGSRSDPNAPLSPMSIRAQGFWRRAGLRMGSFSFNRQLTPSSPKKELASEPKVDSVYQVLKEGNLLRSLKESNTPPSLRSQESTSSSHNSPEPSERCQSNSPHLMAKRPPLTQQLSDPTNMSSQIVPEPNRLCKSAICLRKNDSVDIDSKRTDFKDSDQQNQTELDRLAEGGRLYVALYKYDAQQRNDISLKAGDVIKLANDHNDTWWKGTCNDKSGFFPSNFVMRIRQSERIYSCVTSTILRDFNNKEIQLKRNQIVLVRPDFPTDDVTEIYTRSFTSEGLVRKEDLNPI